MPADFGGLLSVSLGSCSWKASVDVGPTILDAGGRSRHGCGSDPRVVGRVSK
jgi:hypothetical protein